jgi:hypothetical protein
MSKARDLDRIIRKRGTARPSNSNGVRMGDTHAEFIENYQNIRKVYPFLPRTYFDIYDMNREELIKLSKKLRIYRSSFEDSTKVEVRTSILTHLLEMTVPILGVSRPPMPPSTNIDDDIAMMDQYTGGKRRKRKSTVKKRSIKKGRKSIKKKRGGAKKSIKKRVIKRKPKKSIKKSKKKVVRRRKK